MTVLSNIRKRFFSSAPAGPRTAGAGPPGGTNGASRGGGPPIAGYDRLGIPEITHMLRDHPQTELEAIENYEREHQNRVAVLDKLRWMRGPEPLQDYDTLGVDEISVALKGADMATVKKVRGYERKFANRPPVLEEAARVLHLRQADRPVSPAPAYQPLSATATRPRSRD